LLRIFLVILVTILLLESVTQLEINKGHSNLMIDLRLEDNIMQLDGE